MSTQIKTFEDLDVWKICKNLRIKISRIVKMFPAAERFRLGDQIIRAARSVTANIAEGYGRFYYQENIQFCRQARGSLYELLDHLTTALDEKYIDQEVFEDLRTDILRAVSIVNGYIRYLNKAKETDGC